MIYRTYGLFSIRGSKRHGMDHRVAEATCWSPNAENPIHLVRTLATLRKLFEVRNGSAKSQLKRSY